MVFSASSLNRVPTQEGISRAKQSGGSSYTEDIYDFGGFGVSGSYIYLA